MRTRRRAGVLLHVSSLPSRHGLGDFGPEAYAFADFLAPPANPCGRCCPCRRSTPGRAIRRTAVTRPLPATPCSSVRICWSGRGCSGPRTRFGRLNSARLAWTILGPRLGRRGSWRRPSTPRFPLARGLRVSGILPRGAGMAGRLCVVHGPEGVSGISPVVRVALGLAFAG